jgi:cell division protein FtsX
MQTITTTAMQIDWRATAVIAAILLIIGIVIGWIARRKW